ncbi:MAG: BstXI family restriction endonuclease [Rhodocyclaceae bacterium]|nr:BstXI family restriction endonuclease [Rhodocyclaceae bacterium]
MNKKKETAMPPRSALPRLPQLLDRKIYKTGQTRGADDDVIYQNRVGRTSTVLITYQFWQQCRPTAAQPYENGYIVLISPDDYFATPNITIELAAHGLTVGENALVFYETREQWVAHNPDVLSWTPASRRTNPLGGQYVARVPATTATQNGGKINRGFTATRMKGAGIRVYEYASAAIIEQCRLQLEALFWMCRDAEPVAVANGMTAPNAAARKTAILAKCQQEGLLDMVRLAHARMLSAAHCTICPLCLEELSGQGFFSRMEQAEGRAVPDLTVTQLNLFHIEELRLGVLNHRPYNLGWGHHHCNVVVKDSGIIETLKWMRGVLDRNIAEGHLPANSNNGN